MSERSDRAPRKNADVTCTLSLQEGRATVLPGLTLRNISVGGALVEGASVEARQVLTRTPPVPVMLGTSLLSSREVEASVVWAALRGSVVVMGVCFRGLSPEDQDAITQYLQDRRVGVRQDAEFLAEIEHGADGTHQAVVENFSVSGALLSLDDVGDLRVAAGDGVRFRCQYLVVAVLECSATVAWVNRTGDTMRVGLQFEDLSAEHRKLLERFVG